MIVLKSSMAEDEHFEVVEPPAPVEDRVRCI